MEPKLNSEQIDIHLKRAQVKAWDKLRLRQTAEYSAKGITPGDDPELDQKFKMQRTDLHNKMLRHEQWIKELESTGRYDQIDDELRTDDPYQLNRDELPEPDPQSDYFKGFNQGYTLQKLAPELNDQLLKSAPGDSARIQGMKDGSKQFDIDREHAPSNEISPEIWEELNVNKREIEGPPTREPDKGKDIS